MTSTRKTLGALALTLHTALASITSVEVTYTPPEKPTAHTPRVYLALTKDGVEPKSRINDWFNLPILFAIDDIDLDGKVTLTPELLGTTGQLKSLKQGTYWAQTVIRINDDWPMPGTGTGDLFSKTQKIRIIPETPLTLNFTADQKIPAPKFRTKGPVRDAYFRSKSLTQFHERPFNMRYTVMLPKNWNPAKKYPLVIYIFGYTGVHTADNYVRYELGEGTADVITLIPDANCYWGHSVFADSEVNGPWGKALTEELIPFVEKTYGGLGPKHRYVTGTSSGGWASLWLKLRYPDQYESCWSCAPDPLDFQEFLKVDLYKDKSLYRKPSGLLRPMTRIMGFSFPLTFEKFGRYEKILGPGGQLKSLSATFSKRLDDGSPEIWFDQQTGTIDHDVVKSWKKHELTSYLKKQYPLHKKLLKGKINLGVHKRDIFFLNESVQAFEKVAKELNTKATFHYAKGSGHNMTPPFTQKMFKAIQQNLKNQQNPLPSQ